MANEELKAAVQSEPVEKPGVDEEEFFERELFEDVLEMRSLKKVSEITAVELPKLQDQVYQCLYEVYQKSRGIAPPEKNEVLGIFELFFKNYYQHFRNSMEALIARCSPVKVAYFLGKNTDKMLESLDQTIQNISKELV